MFHQKVSRTVLQKYLMLAFICIAYATSTACSSAPNLPDQSLSPAPETHFVHVMPPLVDVSTPHTLPIEKPLEQAFWQKTYNDITRNPRTAVVVASATIASLALMLIAKKTYKPIAAGSIAGYLTDKGINRHGDTIQRHTAALFGRDEDTERVATGVIKGAGLGIVGKVMPPGAKVLGGAAYMIALYYGLIAQMGTDYVEWDPSNAKHIPAKYKGAVEELAGCCAGAAVVGRVPSLVGGALSKNSAVAAVGTQVVKQATQGTVAALVPSKTGLVGTIARLFVKSAKNNPAPPAV